MRRIAGFGMALVFVAALVAGCASDASTPAASTPISTADPLYIKGLDLQIPAGFPDVTVDDDGHVVITVPDADPPTQLQIADIYHGDGPVVHDGDVVDIHYHLTDWRTGQVIDESWGGQDMQFATTGGIEELRQAVIGKTVGSAILAVIPPSTQSPRAMPEIGVEESDTLVAMMYLVQIDG